MQLLQVFFPITVLLCFIESREYHYNKPALPFNEGQSSNQLSISLPTVIKTSGPSATNYELYDLKSSQQIYQGSSIPQPATAAYQQHIPAPINVQVPPQLQHQQAYPTHTQAFIAGAPYMQNYIQQGSQQQVVHHLGAQNSQSTLANPFISHNPNGPATNFMQNIAQYRVSPGQLISTSQPGFNTQPTRGDYVSQSESGHLDGYPYKQQNGDPRIYKRIITTCYPNGQCERLQLNAGPTDPNQYNVVLSTRASTAPVPDKCRRIAEAKRQAALAGTQQTIVTAAQPNVRYAFPLRPSNRRLFPYSEIVLPRDPFN